MSEETLEEMRTRFHQGHVSPEQVEELYYEAIAKQRAIEKKYNALRDAVTQFIGWIAAADGTEIGEELYENLRQALEPKECEHGKPMNDYCQPCGRVNGG